MTPVASLVGSPRIVFAHAYCGGFVELFKMGDTATTHLLAGNGAKLNARMWRPRRTIEKPITWSRPTQCTGKSTSPGVEPVMSASDGICVVAAATSTWPGVEIERSTVSAAGLREFDGSWLSVWARWGVAGGLLDCVRYRPADPTTSATAMRAATARAAGDLIGQIWWVRSFSKLGNSLGCTQSRSPLGGGVPRVRRRRHHSARPRLSTHCRLVTTSRRSGSP